MQDFDGLEGGQSLGTLAKRRAKDEDDAAAEGPPSVGGWHRPDHGVACTRIPHDMFTKASQRRTMRCARHPHKHSGRRAHVGIHTVPNLEDTVSVLVATTATRETAQHSETQKYQ
jgi:hypothetical protein